MSNRGRDRLCDMLDAIDTIEQLVDGRSRDDVFGDKVLRAAYERLLEIISEASRQLPEPWKERFPDVPWREIAAIGNRLRHAYWGLDAGILWSISSKGYLKHLKEVARELMRDNDTTTP
jgi:uncharacterized protein with HEPN domain